MSGERFKITPHTSEVGLEAVGSDLPELFGNAAAGLLALWGISPQSPSNESPFEENPSPRLRGEVPAEGAGERGIAEFKVDLDGTDEGDLFVVWLNELVYLIQTRKVRPTLIAVTSASPQKLSAVVTGTLAAKERDLAIEIKSATRTGELVKKTKTGWTAKVILDV